MNFNYFKIHTNAKLRYGFNRFNNSLPVSCNLTGLNNDAVNQSITRNANGTISSIVENGVKHTYAYDNVGRLLSETCSNGRGQNGIFSSAYTYDRNSNITTLTRTGYPGGMSLPSYPVDDLTMAYDGNRLIKVTDNADEVLVEKTFDFYDGANNSVEYAYDSNGNVTRDDNRGLTDITYNALNLPSHIEVGSDAIMDYIYDATGNKLGIRSRICYVTNRESAPDIIELPYRAEDRDYIGNYEFKNGELLRLNTPYGYCTLGSYIPYRRDYQGNNRNNADYYAYGLPVQDSNVSDQDPYLYGGKEFYSLKGINIYDFNARTYAPDIARFMQPDPKAGDYHWLSPYTFCASDPINFIDKDGKRPTAKEAVLLAKHVYGGDDAEEVNDELTNTQWHISDFKTSIEKNIGTGLNSELYERTRKDGVTEYAYVFAGTNSLVDGGDDILQVVGASDQYKKAIQNAQTLSDELNKSGKKFDLTFIGHSLGGGEATAASMATGHPAVTFNPAAVSIFTKLTNNFRFPAKVANYITLGKQLFGTSLYIGGDPLNNAQMKLGLKLSGKIFWVQTNSMKLSHGIDNFLNKELPDYEDAIFK